MDKIEFEAEVVIIPGLNNSGEQHWQTHWANKYGFTRIDQKDWDKPKSTDWINALDQQLNKLNDKPIILVAHSLGCITAALWAQSTSRKIKAALLVAPADTEAKGMPSEIQSFKPIPLERLPFKSIVVASTNDNYVSLQRANNFAQSWGSEFINVGAVGHINSDSNLGEWELGLELLKELDRY
ncbi:alpha/beta hydrolase [Solitalea sp. MAHUQ-68]|uniref:Alpha/beta hydrolase n=1 Tax=Solitalea agri TaxID=2953739 RepID=A0A9X2F3L4_9SPHI|nr:alpha/beta hydrolase [Solitalea agri]MCO4293614.1 alpha/beta hydrolase [Solitalea agri]